MWRIGSPLSMQQVLQRAARVNLPPEARRCPPSVGPTGDAEGWRGCHLHGCPPPVLSPERGVALFSLRGDITCPVGSAPGCSGGVPEEPVIWRGWGAGEGARRDPFPGVSWLILGQTSPVKASGQGNLQPQPSQGLWESRNLEPRAEGARLGN